MNGGGCSLSNQGEQFENEVQTLIENLIEDSKKKGKWFEAEIYKRIRIQGLSSYWTPDIVLVAKSLLGNSLSGEEYSINLAVIECNFIHETAPSGVYWTSMGRAYMELNDLKLNPELYADEFFLVVNRHYKGTRNYVKVFKNIGVDMVNIHDSSERLAFKKQMSQLLTKYTFKEQLSILEKLIKELETEKIKAENTEDMH